MSDQAKAIYYEVVSRHTELKRLYQEAIKPKSINDQSPRLAYSCDFWNAFQNQTEHALVLFSHVMLVENEFATVMRIDLEQMRDHARQQVREINNSN